MHILNCGKLQFPVLYLFDFNVFYLPDYTLCSFQNTTAMEDIGVKNMKGLADAFRRSQSVEYFLLDPNIFIPLKATTVDHPTRLTIEFDYDGVVVELKTLEGLNIPFSEHGTLQNAPAEKHLAHHKETL